GACSGWWHGSDVVGAILFCVGPLAAHRGVYSFPTRRSSDLSEEMAQLIWALGAMAAERVFYGENSTGVGGDVQGATARAAWMVGDRKSTRLNSSHVSISYAVFCLKKKTDRCDSPAPIGATPH